MMRALILAVIVTASGCGGAPHSASASWAQTVDRLRQSSDQWLSERDLERAESDLRRIFQLTVPAETRGADQLLQDAHFALGSLLLLKRQPDDAIAEANKGLALSTEKTVFRANLLALRALATEAKGQPLDALDDYGRALEIHKALFDNALASYEEDAAK